MSTKRLSLMIMGSLLAVAPIAWGTTFTGAFTTSGGQGTLGSATDTFSNFGTSGLNVVGSCVETSGFACTVQNAGTQFTPTTTFSLGVDEPGTGGSTDTAIQQRHGEGIIFNFTTSVTLQSFVLDLGVTANNPSNWVLWSCTSITGAGTAGSPYVCAGATTLGLNVSTANGSVAGTTENVTLTTATAGQFFEIAAGTTTTTKFGVDSLTFGYSTTPEPATFGMVGASLLGLAGFGLRGKKNS